MKKSVVVLVLVLFFLAPKLMAQGEPITPAVSDADKIKIIGHALFYADSPYLSIMAILSNRGVPLLNAKIRMNDVLLRTSGSGIYAGSIPTPYKSDLGHEYVFTIEQMTPASSGRGPRTERIVLASYRVDNLFTWISPSRGQVINLAAYPLGEIPLRWKFAAAPVPFQLIIKDLATGAVIFSRTIASDGHTLNTAALRPGKTYSLLAETFPAPSFGPLGRFKLGKGAAPGSDVRFDCSYYYHFSTAPAK